MAELEVRLVRYFLAVVDHGSFTRAAAALHLSQPALSQAVRRLEALLGAELLDRGVTGSRDPLVLTGAGLEFEPAGRELVRAADRAVRAAQVVGRRVRLVVGFGTDTPRSQTRRLLQVADADIEVTLQHVQWGQERRSLDDGSVDLTFLQAPPGLVDPTLTFAVLDRVTRVAVFPEWHRLASRGSITLEDIADEPIVDAGSNRAYWLVDPRPDGRAPTVVGPPARTADEMLAVVAAGQGMAITSSTLAATNQSPELAFVPITDLDPGVIYLAARAADRRAAVRTLLARLSG